MFCELVEIGNPSPREIQFHNGSPWVRPASGYHRVSFAASGWNRTIASGLLVPHRLPGQARLPWLRAKQKSPLSAWGCFGGRQRWFHNPSQPYSGPLDCELIRYPNGAAWSRTRIRRSGLRPGQSTVSLPPQIKKPCLERTSPEAAANPSCDGFGLVVASSPFLQPLTPFLIRKSGLLEIRGQLLYGH